MVLDSAFLSRDVPLRRGITLRCHERAGAGGPTVLLLHGYGDSGRAFAPILPWLPRSWRVIAPDQRGHGDSDRPAEGYGVPQLASDAAALLDALAVREAVVVGHSMGSFVAQQLALDHPARVERLALVGAAACASTAAVDAMAAELRSLDDPVPDAFVREFQKGCLARPVPEAFFEDCVAQGRRLPAWIWRAVYEGFARFDARDRLGAVGCPALVVWGDRDAIFERADQDALLAALPRASLLVYEGTGHCPNWEEPERFARDLAAFVEAAAGTQAA